MSRLKYRKKDDQFVVAVQLTLDTGGFTYNKWGGKQKCKQGDWLVDNFGDCYTIDEQSFAKTYKKLRQGHYVKTTPVWVELAKASGQVSTKEGKTSYQPGDYLVSNNLDGSDAYAISKNKFESTYVLDEK